jgi:hypothetical protein
MNKLKNIFLYIIILFSLLIITRNLIAKTAIESIAKATTGLSLSITKINIALTKSTIDIRGLKLDNPESFPEPIMLDMPVISADYDLEDLFKGMLRFRHLTLYLNEFFVVKNKAGTLNLDAFKLAKKEEAAAPKEEAKKSALKIDVLDLRIGRVVYKDYSKGIAPRVEEFNVNINERYKNITDINSFARLLVVRALANTAISRLTGFDVGALKGEIKEVLKSVSKLTKDVTTDTLKAGKSSGAKVIDKVTVTTEKAAKKVGQIIPFSKKDTQE